VELKWSKFQNSKILHIFANYFLVIAFGIASGWVVAQGSMIILIFVGAMALLALLLYLQTRTIEIFTLQRILLYLTIIAGFVGPAFLAIPVGPIHIFPYRVLLPILWFILIIQILANQGKLAISHIKVKRYLLFLGVWLIYAIFSMAWAVSKSDAIKDIIFLFTNVSIIFFVVYYFSNDKDLKRFYYLWIAVFGGLLLLGVWEHLTGQHLPISGYYLETRARFMFRPTGVFHNPNDYATFLALSIPFALGALRYAKNMLVRLIGLGEVATAFYLIVVAGSRSNILAVLLEIAFLVLLLSNLRQRFKIIVTAITCLAIAVFFLPGPVQQFFSQVGDQLSSLTTQAQLGTGSVAVRMNLARNGLISLYSTAGFGVGAGNAEYWMANFAQYDTAGILNPHNWWLEILINYGIFVFIGYVVIYFGIIRKLWHAWHKAVDRKERMIAEALLLAFIGFFFASISSSSIMAFNPQWLLFAFALAFLNWQLRSQKGWLG